MAISFNSSPSNKNIDKKEGKDSEDKNHISKFRQETVSSFYYFKDKISNSDRFNKRLEQDISNFGLRCKKYSGFDKNALIYLLSEYRKEEKREMQKLCQIRDKISIISEVLKNKNNKKKVKFDNYKLNKRFPKLKIDLVKEACYKKEVNDCKKVIK